MTEKCFVDTNILVYASVTEDPICSPAARKLLSRIGSGRRTISTQVLLEYANVSIRTFGVRGAVLTQAIELQRVFEIYDTTAADVIAAVRLTQSTSISIWDAMIVVAAAKAGCGTLYTEDLNHGQVIAGVRVINPFKENVTP